MNKQFPTKFKYMKEAYNKCKQGQGIQEELYRHTVQSHKDGARKTKVHGGMSYRLRGLIFFNIAINDLDNGTESTLSKPAENWEMQLIDQKVMLLSTETLTGWRKMKFS